MAETRKQEGPRLHRALVIVFSCILGVLVYWLLGFVMDDIGTLRGPEYADVEVRHLDPTLVQEAGKLDEQFARLNRQQSDVREKQALLRESTSTSQETLSQLLEMQQVSLQKGVALSEAGLKAFTDSQRLFLSNQRKFQAYTEELERLREEGKALQPKRDEIEKQLGTQRQQAHEEHASLLRRHEWKKAALKLLVLIPLVFLVARFFLKKRASIFAPIIYACGIAVLAKLILVIHEYFPTEYFKYIVILAALGVVAQILIYMLRMIAFPKKPWLLKQYREAYERFSCPICAYPIRRGPLKYVLWTRQTRKNLSVSASTGPVSDDPYACPACGTMLYESCAACQAVRHALLPFCEKCGAAKEFASTAALS